LTTFNDPDERPDVLSQRIRVPIRNIKDEIREWTSKPSSLCSSCRSFVILYHNFDLIIDQLTGLDISHNINCPLALIVFTAIQLEINMFSLALKCDEDIKKEETESDISY